MKKILLALSLIAVFFIYILFKKWAGEDSIQSTIKPLTGSGTALSNPSAPVATSAPGEENVKSTPMPNKAGSGMGTGMGIGMGIRMGMGMGMRQGPYKNGVYVGSTADAYFGNVQVKAIIQNGFITDVQFLQYPNTHSYSIAINTQAMPYLTREAIQAQSAKVDIVSGATQTSLAFMQSLGDALAQAKN
jgi:uncharacterized protein with FMN-binding domain